MLIANRFSSGPPRDLGACPAICTGHLHLHPPHSVLIDDASLRLPSAAEWPPIRISLARSLSCGLAAALCALSGRCPDPVASAHGQPIVVSHRRWHPPAVDANSYELVPCLSPSFPYMHSPPRRAASSHTLLVIDLQILPGYFHTPPPTTWRPPMPSGRRENRPSAYAERAL
jgi:hypothetical protein